MEEGRSKKKKRVRGFRASNVNDHTVVSSSFLLLSFLFRFPGSDRGVGEFSNGLSGSDL